MLSKSSVQQQPTSKQATSSGLPPVPPPHPFHPHHPHHHPQFMNRSMFAHPPPPLPPRDNLSPPPLPPRAPAPNYEAPSHVRQRSDSGLVGVGGTPEPTKTNTWPFRPRGGGGGGGGNGSSGNVESSKIHLNILRCPYD